MSDTEMLDEENFGDDLEVIEEATEEPAAPEAEEEAGDGTPKVVKVKRTRNPQPKLNAESLKGKRGLTALPSYFERVQFKGRGHEEQDLDVILKTYEYWCHRLFPKYPFDDCIAKIEQLGTKKPVMTHIKRIRYDILLEDAVIDDNIIEAPDAFDDLLPTPDPTPEELSEEQLERIRINKETAERKRRERLQRQMGETSSYDFDQTETQNDDPPISQSSNSNGPVDSDEESLGAQGRDASQSVDGSPSLPTTQKSGRVLNRILDSDDDDEIANSNEQNARRRVFDDSDDEIANGNEQNIRTRVFDDSDNDSHDLGRVEEAQLSPSSSSTTKNDTRSRLRVLVDSDED